MYCFTSVLTHRSSLLSLPGPSQILHKRKKMHLKVLFSFHFPLRFKSLVFLHFSFIPSLACAESDYNILNLQETQSSPKCSLGSWYMCSPALSCSNYCHLRVSSCVQVPLRHAQPHLQITAKWIQDGLGLCITAAPVCRGQGIALPESKVHMYLWVHKETLPLAWTLPWRGGRLYRAITTGKNSFILRQCKALKTRLLPMTLISARKNTEVIHSEGLFRVWFESTQRLLESRNAVLP